MPFTLQTETLENEQNKKSWRGSGEKFGEGTDQRAARSLRSSRLFVAFSDKILPILTDENWFSYTYSSVILGESYLNSIGILENESL